jgi:hypothetical protein
MQSPNTDQRADGSSPSQGGTGYSFAHHAEEIVHEAQDYLASVAMAGPLPRSVEARRYPPSPATTDRCWSW